MARHMPVEAPSPLDRYLLAQEVETGAWETVRASQRVADVARLTALEARHAAVLAIACPYCPAGVGEVCQHEPGSSFHRNVTHGMRDDLAGVNGQPSLDRALRRA